MPPGKRSEPDPERPWRRQRATPWICSTTRRARAMHRLAGDGLRLVRPYPFDFVCHVKRRNEGLDVVNLFAREFPARPRRYYEEAHARGLLRVEHAPNSKRAKMERARDDAGQGASASAAAAASPPSRFDRSRPASAFATRFIATSLPFWTIPFAWWRRRTTWWRCTSPRRFPCTPRASTAKTQSSGFSPRSALISAGFSPRTGWIRTSRAAPHGAPRGGGERAAKTGGRTRGS